MNLSELLDLLSANSVEISVNDANLKIVDAHQFITPELIDLIRANKPGLLELLTRRGELGQLVRVPRQADQGLALSAAQQRLWFVSQIEGIGTAYHISAGLRLSGSLDRAALQSALDLIVARHEALRSVFRLQDGVPLQYVNAATGFALRSDDLRDSAQQPEALAALLAEDAAQRFDLTAGPLFRARLIRLGEQEHVLLVTLHHIVSDGWSMGVLINELNQLYGAFSNGQADPLPPLDIQYADYAVWQRNVLQASQLQAQQAYWQQTLSGAPVLLTLPTDQPRPLQQAHAGARIAFKWDATLTQGLKALAQRHGATLFMTVLSGWAVLLSRLSGQDDVVIGSPVANRSRLELEALIGLFVNTLALRLDVSGNPSVAQLLERTRQRVLESQPHQELPFEQVVERLNPPRSLAHTPLFQVMLAWQNTEDVALKLGDLHLEPLAAVEVMTKFDLTLELGEVEGCLGGSLEYATALFDAATVNRHLDYLRRLLAAMVADEHCPVGLLAMLPEEERRQLLSERNDTQVPGVPGQLIHQLFEARAALTPDAVAVEHNQQRMAYRSLNEQANRLAHHLRGLGVRPDDRVALCLDRSIDMVLGMLAILKAGAAYVPLDPHYPGERLSYMLQDSTPTVVLTHAALRARLGQLAVPVLELDSQDADWQQASVDNPDAKAFGLTGSNLAYVIYTSGSTGQPKGVMVEHRGVTNMLAWYLEDVRLEASDAVLLLTSHSFDLTQKNIFASLAVGATLHLAGTPFEPQRIVRQIREQHITHLNLAPSAFYALLDVDDLSAFGSVRRVVLGGEPIKLAQLLKLPEPRPLFINSYGPTECSDVVAWHCADARLERYEAQGIPLGRPIRNLKLYLLDPFRQLAPSGSVAELYIAGAGVARGYLNRPELSAEKFIPDPFSDEVDARMYKTGDLARYLPDGTLEYLGRNDDQVKIRGQRIELGEVETLLGLHPGVDEAVVLVQEDSQGDSRLVAYYTLHDGALADAAVLRLHLSAQLPEYMVPAAYVPLESLPLTANGKLDRRALPIPDDSTFGRSEYVAPVGPVETLLAAIWAQVLKLEQVGRHDNFFALGGHSLLAVSLMERMRQAGLNADIQVLFGQPTLSALALALDNAPTRKTVEVPSNLIPVGCTAITPAMLPLAQLTQAEIDTLAAQVDGGAGNIQDIYPLAPLQEGVLFHHMASSGGDPYLQNLMMSVDSRVQLDAFLGALQAVIARHDILRTGIFWEGLGEPMQVVLRQAQLLVEEVALSSAAGDIEAQLAERFDPRHYRLDVRRAPLVQVFVAQDAPNERWLLQLLYHHVVMDHTALEIVQHEIDLHVRGEAWRLPAPLPFRNFVAQARLGVSVEEHETYFRAQLADVDEPTLPFGLLDVQGDGSTLREARQVLDLALAERLRQRAQWLGVSAASLFHLAWAQVLGRVSGREDVVFGTVLFGRMQGGEGADRVLGMFINTLPIRVRLGRIGVRDGVRQTHDALSALLVHEHASLALAQRCSGVAAPLPLFSALLNYRYVQEGGAATGEAGPDANGFTLLGGEERTNYPLVLSVDDLGRGFELVVQADGQLDAQGIAGYMNKALESLMTALEQTPGQPLHALDILPGAERRQLLEAWNDTALAYADDLCLHEVFEAQVARAPHAVAVVHERNSIRYAELNLRANRLAHYLRGLGIGPEERVGLCLERGLEMVVGVLAILKAGAAYVPLDPTYPAERLAYMLEDSAPRVVLTQGSLAGLLEQTAVPLLQLDTQAALWAEASEQNVRNMAGPSNLAYVIYTSGSTGKPKGVMVEHGSVVNQITGLQQRYGLNAQDRILQFASITFDMSVEELFGALLSGATAVLRTDEWLGDAAHFYGLCRAYEITLVNIPPIFWQSLLQDTSVEIPASLRQVTLGGEAVGQSSMAAWFAREGHRPALFNAYGPTETTVNATIFEPQPSGHWLSIGKPVANTRIYLLDRHGEPVPLGVAGELCIGGVGVARGYLNREQLTQEKFVADPFSSVPGARLYKTGDLARYLADGNLEYLGRNDDQVKIRGFRIELGEIEALLGAQPGVRDVAVLAREDEAGGKRLVGYYTVREGATVDPQVVRTALSAQLPDYMVPAAYVELAAMPLTSNGKLDRRALPAPGESALGRSDYAAPVGPVESLLADLWAEVLKVERVGRYDNFFELGGHSLLAVSLMERMRRAGLNADIRVLFGQPTLVALANAVGGTAPGRIVEVPANRIALDCQAITPEMLPLVRLTQAQIDSITAQVEGGVANVQDIYPLAPLQEGVLFHHRTSTESDPYLESVLLSIDQPQRLEDFLAALQSVIDRHDILRSAMIWEGLDEPVQVVWRQARLMVERLVLAPEDGDIGTQLSARFDPRHNRLDLRQAPLMRVAIAHDPLNGRWLLHLLHHHIVMDHTGLEIVHREIDACLRGDAQALPVALPFRNFVAQARLGMSISEHEAYFRERLGDLDEPTLPFELAEVQGDGRDLRQVRQRLDEAVAERVRRAAQRQGVSAASLFHLAWAQVLGRLSGREDVVFGTVLFGRMQGGEGADQVLGMFINTLPIRIRLGAVSARDGLFQTHEALASLLVHEHASLALAQRCSGVAAPLPLFSALLNYRHSSEAQDSGTSGIAVLGGEERTNYPLVLSVDDLGQGFELVLQVDSRLDEKRIVGYMKAAVAALVQGLEEQPGAALRGLDVLPAVERHELLSDLNPAVISNTDPRCLQQLFEAQVARAPQAIAVAFEQDRLSYGELNRRANRLAHHLRELGVGADDRVALCVERGLEMLVGILAILKAGAGYVPLDPVYPTERLQYLLDDSRPSVVITFSHLRETLGDLSMPVLELDTQAWQWAECSEENPDVVTTPASLAYVIYTSGSTGQPKGVMVEHGNVTRLFSSTEQSFGFGPSDVWTLFHSFAFDFSVWEIWGALLHGGRLEVLSGQTVRAPELFYGVLCERGVTVLNQTPSAFRQLIAAQDGRAHSLRWVIFGGEALEPGALAPWYARSNNAGTQLVNMYGITETTVHVTFRALGAGDVTAHAGRSPIGEKLKDLRVYLLDRFGQPVPFGVVGELYVGGAGVARGYLNRPELTAQRFLRDPFSDEPDARMYRTGDLARYLADGELQYLGRNDDQVKIRGFRIELGEIEALLGTQASVREVAVLAREDQPGEKRLVAYYTLNDSATVESTDLRAHLSAGLPEYMVPTAYVELEKMPLTANGKLDRRALPAPDETALTRGEYAAPIGAVEERLAEIWADVLKVERVGRHDNFFELGGHSLLAVSLMERMRRAGLNADVQVLFGQPTLSALALALDQAPARKQVEVPPNLIPLDCTAITPAMLPLAQLTQSEIDTITAQVEGGVANVQDIYPLAPLQEGVLFHHMANRSGDPYVLNAMLGLDSREQLERFVQALQAVIERHDILRTAVLWEGLNEPMQVVMRRARLLVEEVSLSSEEGSIEDQLSARFDPRHYRLDVRRAPMLRAFVAEDVPNGRWLLQLLYHHAVMDHTALEIVHREIEFHLNAESGTLPTALPFRNFVAQARLGMSTTEHEAYFREQLADVDEPTLPFGMADVQGHGRDVREVRQALEPRLSGAVRQIAQQLGVSAASLFHLAWAQVLGRVSGREDVVFGTVLFGRMQGGEGSDQVLGMFINTLPIRIRLGDTSVRQGLDTTHKALAALLVHEHASLALAQRCSGVKAPLPLFSALLNYRHSAAEQSSVTPGIAMLSGEERTNYPLVLSVDDLDADFELVVQADPQVDARRIVGYVTHALESLVRALQQTPMLVLSRLPILPAAERQLLLETWNETPAVSSHGVFLHQLFEARAASVPEAIALVHEQSTLGYGELNQRANRLAHHLRDLGVGPDDRVALCVERGAQLVVAMLAILKAGAAYVPLDPAYPGERLRYLLADSAPGVVLTFSHLRAVLGECPVPVLELDTHAEQWQDASAENPEYQAFGLTPENLAYVIYTSGSTGQPKGVMVEHRSVANMLDWYLDDVRLEASDAVLLLTSHSFDLTQKNIFGCLATGAVLHLAPTVFEPRRIVAQIHAHGITHINLAPSAFFALAEADTQGALSAVRRVVLGGEPINLAALQALPEPRPCFINSYGPTECSDVVAWHRLDSDLSTYAARGIPLGKPIHNLRLYLLDAQGQPAPLGVVAELYIGGAGVARGYLNRPELTAERFLRDPFSTQPGARMYRTGDLARYLENGELHYLGRNDDQVKIRGQRVELGEIEARLVACAPVQEACVLARGDMPGGTALVAYYTLPAGASLDPAGLRAELSTQLPEYMLPVAYVELAKMPLTPNGKLDRRALPAPDESALGRGQYTAPVGAVEVRLAEIWAEVLQVERIGRHDNFFELGGHSLLAVSLMERMRRAGLNADIQVLFGQPTLAALALALDTAPARKTVEVPPNLIPDDCTMITPAMLPLAQLTQVEIDTITAQVEGGVANVQDIYPLAPLQEGVLFHHMASHEGDPYLQQVLLSIDSREQLDGFVAALQTVVDRHDILRTAVLWDGLGEPMQVVLRQARLVTEEVVLAPEEGAVEEQLTARFDPRHYRLDMRRAPMLRACIAEDVPNGRWLLQLLYHHAVMDHTALELVQQEVELHLRGETQDLPAPLPFRNFVAQARLSLSVAEHEAYFREQLGDVDEPTLPFGIADVQGDGSEVLEERLALADALAGRLRETSQRLGVSTASLFHLAWAQVLGRVSGREDVVFGTVLFGRMQGGEGADRVLGMFINTLPIRIRLEGGVRDSVLHTHQLLSGLLVHEHASLTLAQRCSGVAAPLPLFSALLNYRHLQALETPDTDAGRATGGVRLLGGEERTNYPLVLSVDDLGQAFELVVQADRQLDGQRIAGYMNTALESLVEALGQVPARPLRQLEILPAVERRQLLEAWNETALAYPRERCLHELFEERSVLAPDALALVHEQSHLSYGELNRRANRLAHYLRGLGIGPEERVGLCLERGLEMVVGVLAILKAGAAYVPLDPTYPAERLAYMLEDSAPRVVLTQGSLAGLLEQTAVPLLQLDTQAALWAEASEQNVRNMAGPSNLAYVIYTSGSTGKPKGVMVEHGSVVNQITGLQQRYGLNAQDRILQFASITFDMSVEELFGALLSGATAVLRTDEWLGDAAHFYGLCRAYEITLVNIPPIFWQSLLQDTSVEIPASLRQVTLGGEAVGQSSMAAWFAREGHRPALFNAYGPTETTVNATIFEPQPSGHWLSIGKPVANTRIYLLDRHGEPVPLGVAGELCIGGVGVARGYLNREQLTQEKFVADPFSSVPGARLYKTGDLARYLADGNLEYLGRNDDQVKIRGFRIELGEIEALLGAQPGVRDVAVLAREDEAGGKRLVGYYTVREGATVDPQAVRAALSAQLPDYMVPAAYVELAAMPLTSNGKLDRRALPAPGESALGRSDYAAPVGPVESLLADLWAEVLKVERVGRYDNFFELGGHSLLAMRLVSSVRAAFGRELKLKALFARPQLAALAELLGQMDREQSSPIRTLARTAPLPLSYGQQRLWFLGQMEDLGSAYHMSAGLRLFGALDRRALQAALNRIVVRHEALRTRFVAHDGVPMQHIEPAEGGLPALCSDLVGQADPAGALASLLAQELESAFDLSTGPLIRARLVRVEEQEHVLWITLHHIVSDGWSMGLFNQELSALYQAFSNGQDDPLPPLPIQYGDYAVWQREWLAGPAQQGQLEYWRAHLADAPQVQALPTDRPRPRVQSYAGASVEIELDAGLAGRLTALALRQGTTLYSVVLAGWAALVGRLSGQAEVMIGTPVANRPRVETEALIGFFVNTLALRLDVSGAPDTAELLARVREVTLQAQSHQDVPFEQVVEALNPTRSLAHSPVFQLMFGWDNTPQDATRPGSLGMEPVVMPGTMTPFDLSLNLEDGEGGVIGGRMIYAEALFDRVTIERHLGYLQALLGAMAADETSVPAQVPVLGDQERQRLLVEWNETAVDYPAEHCLHALFERQAALAPKASAVVHGQVRVSYGELNRKANQLARHLVRLGVGPERQVAICAPRSVELVVGVLAILKAGAAYVPLDPEYPAERLQYLLDDSQPVVLLTRAGLHPQLSALDIPVLELGGLRQSWEHEAVDNLDESLSGAGSDSLAYVIYTSGSTGQPKGVMVEHRSISNLVLNNGHTHIDADDRIALVANPAFDALTFELWAALLQGATSVVVDQDTLLQPTALARYLEEQQVTVLHLTAGLLAPYREALSGLLPKLRYFMTGGDRVDVAAVASILEQCPPQVLLHCYGPTECTTFATLYQVQQLSRDKGSIPLGRPLGNTRLYILDSAGEPVPTGVIGELCIGGAGVARGYLNREELSQEKFVADPFSAQPGARMYKSGDLARYLADGNVEFLGRNDAQVKIRGFRIELGEIEARLGAHGLVREALVLALDEASGGKRLVAYYTLEAQAQVEVAELHAHLAAALPDYMLPSAYVALEEIPLTANGKLDRRALPVPDENALVRGEYMAPQGEVETLLAGVWAEVLQVERVGRHDNFFELGGHSLLAVSLMERMRQAGVDADIRVLFGQPTLAALAQALKADTTATTVVVPPNLIPAQATAITPDMLTLVQLSQAEIDAITAQVEGGVANVQDIYPLAPLQEGVLFHHMASRSGDPYVLNAMLSLDSREHLDRFLAALQGVIDRHDILRTAVLWEGLREPQQVVLREARLIVDEVQLSVHEGDIETQLGARFDPRQQRLDVRQAPMLRACVAEDAGNQRWLLQLLYHHAVMDHTALEIMQREIDLLLRGEADTLAAPLPFRNFVAQTRLGMSVAEHEAYFREQLGDVDEPTLPFGLADVQGDGHQVREVLCTLDTGVSGRLRQGARQAGVSVASLFHLAWAQVLGRISGREDVVFGTVLFGRMQGGEGAAQVLGMFINTLPIRVRLGDLSVREGIQRTHEALASLLSHEHASLALAQRCSAVVAPAPLFSALLNYRHSSEAESAGVSGIAMLGAEERTNYPLVLSVNDLGQGFELVVQADRALDAERIAGYVDTALGNLAQALEGAEVTGLRSLEILSPVERRQLLVEWNQTAAPAPEARCVQSLFEAQVRRRPDAVAVVHEQTRLSYDALNRRANRLAHYLREQGIGPQVCVGLCLERGIEMVVGVLAILKAGAVYLPLDASYPVDRLHYILADSAPAMVLTHSRLLERLGRLSMPVVALDSAAESWQQASSENLDTETLGLPHDPLAYVIYTSGSTGQPKGVMVGMAGLVNRLTWSMRDIGLERPITALKTNIGFVDSVNELLGTLIAGGELVVFDQLAGSDVYRFVEFLAEHRVNHLVVVPSLLEHLVPFVNSHLQHLSVLVCSGERLAPRLVNRIKALDSRIRLFNFYGSSEVNGDATAFECRENLEASVIGRPIANTRLYLLDSAGQVVPRGTIGELYVGGAGVARGYLNRPELTRERFLPDPFSDDPQARLFRTGDLARYLDDGLLEYLGRNDHQVKIRGFRIELGEIEAQLGALAAIKDAVVVAAETTAGDRQLVAYYRLHGHAQADAPDNRGLRQYLLSVLPSHMVPAAYVRLETWPLTPNGKLDRRLLPEPDGTAYGRQEYEAPEGEVEELLAEIWAEVLHLERVGRDDDFFELGGHSLLAVALIEQMRQAGLSADLRMLFEHPTLAALANAAEEIEMKF